MKRPNKAAITSAVEEFGRLETRRISIELKRDRELLPHQETYEKKAGPIVAAAKTQLDSIAARKAVLAGEIGAELMSGVDEKAGTVALSQVAVELEVVKQVHTAVAKLNKAEAEEPRLSESNKPLVQVIAEVQVKDAPREIDAEKFFNFVKVTERSAKFWGSLKVLIGEAEKFLGGKIDELATKQKKYSVSISLKP